MTKVLTTLLALALGATPSVACEYMKQQRDATASLSQTPAPQTNSVQQSSVPATNAAQTAEPVKAPQPETQTAQTPVSPDQPKPN